MMNSWALTDKGAVRKQNQDAFYLDCGNEKDFSLLVVCDGMGGAKAGDVASRSAIEIFSDEIERHYEPNHSVEMIQRLMTEAAKKANRDVFEKSILNYDYDGMGTTLVAAIIRDDQCIVANIGDSRAYHITPEKIEQITRDHSVVEDLVERGEMTREQANNHPQRNLITRAIGTAFDVEVDTFSLTLAEGDYILLCSDGLSNALTEQELKIIACGTEDAKTACEKYLSIALENEAADNVTVVLFEK